MGGETTVGGGTVFTAAWEESDSETPLLRLVKNTGGGLTVAGVSPGDALVHAVGQDGSVRRYAVRVTQPGVAGLVASKKKAAKDVFTPGYQTAVEYWVDDYAHQPTYEQMVDPQWQGYIGCGPNAWATLLAWWEIQRGDYLAFGEYLTFDAPKSWQDGDPRGKLRPVLLDLRNAMGGIYNPFDGSFATPPWDMPKGPKHATFFQDQLGWLARSWKMRWSDFAQTLNGDGGATEVRDALKKNYCAVVGLGCYWHFGVAYGYQKQDFIGSPGGAPLFSRRRLRCNMCWGPDTGNAHWRDFYDTFFSSRFKLRVTANAPGAQ